MRAAVLLSALLLTGARGQDLKRLYEGHRWFELRDALRSQKGSPLYRGAVAAAFNESRQAEIDLRSVIQAASQSREASEARDWLSYLYMRAGQYQRAAGVVADGDSMRAVFSQLPDQSVVSRQSSAVPYRIERSKLFLPVTVNGKQAEFFVDSDANFPFISESEARHLGLKFRDGGARVAGATGRQAPFRTAVAEEFAVGNFRMKNVSFMVLSDDEKLFHSLPLDQQGAIGLPVILAFQTIRFGDDGKFRFGFAAKQQSNNKPNLCFDGSDPVTQIRFQNRDLDVVLDTGDEVSELWPLFQKQFNLSGEKGSKQVKGFGGESEIPAITVPQVQLQIGGFDATLRPAHLLLSPTTENSKWYYARIGLDALRLAHQVTMDFRSLRLTLE